MEYYGVTSSPLAVSFSGVGFPHVVHHALSNLRLQRLTTLHQKYCGYLHLSAISFSEIYMYILLSLMKSLFKVFITLLKNLCTDFADFRCFYHASLGVLKSMTGLVHMITVTAARVVATNEHSCRKFLLHLNWRLGHVLARVFAHILGQFEQNKHYQSKHQKCNHDHGE